MSWLISLIVGLLRALLPAIVDAAKPTCEDAKKQPELRRKLRNRIKGTWHTSAVALLLLTAFWLPGCRPRTIYVPHGEPVRLRETCRNVDVWVMDASGTPTAGRMDLPEGWYCLPVEDEEEKKK